jgi:hypothetical protein
VAGNKRSRGKTKDTKDSSDCPLPLGARPIYTVTRGATRSSRSLPFDLIVPSHPTPAPSHSLQSNEATFARHFIRPRYFITRVIPLGPRRYHSCGGPCEKPSDPHIAPLHTNSCDRPKLEAPNETFHEPRRHDVYTLHSKARRSLRPPPLTAQPRRFFLPAPMTTRFVIVNGGAASSCAFL